MIYVPLVSSSFLACRIWTLLLQNNRHTCIIYNNTKIWCTQVRKYWNRIQIQKQHHLENEKLEKH